MTIAFRSPKAIVQLSMLISVALLFMHCDRSQNELTDPHLNIQAAPVVKDQTPRARLGINDILSALGDSTQSDGTLLVALKEPGARRGVGTDGVVLPVEARFAAENALQQEFPGLTVERGVRRIIQSVTPTGTRVDTLHRTYIAVRATWQSRLLEALRNNPNVDYIQPNYSNGVAFGSGSPISVVKMKRRWTQTTPWGVLAVRAPQAWAAGYTGQGINIGMVDTGADLSPVGHPDLAFVPLYGMFTNFTAHNSNDPCQNYLEPCWWEDIFHGTGVIGAAVGRDNADGSVGVAPANTTPMLAKAAANGVGLREEDFADAVLHVTNNWNWFSDPVRVAVTSIGFDDAFLHNVLHDAFIQAAAQNNVLWFAAAGNNNYGNGGFVVAPARFDEVVAVSALSQNLNLTDSSSTGPEVELAAPGENLRVSWNRQDDDTGQYEFTRVVSGTSYAAPIAAGVARLALEKFPTWTASQLRGAMQNYARDLGAAGRDNLYGYGMVDAPCLINQLSPCILLTGSINGPDEVPPEAFCQWDAVVSGGLPPYSYSWSGVLSGNQASVSGMLFSSGWLYLTVTDATSQVINRQLYITIDWGAFGGCMF